MKLTVATYNICHCADWTDKENGSPKVKIEKTANLIKSAKPDIIGLNEVYADSKTREEFKHQIVKLSNFTDIIHHAYAVGKRLDWGDVIGNGMLSRYRMVSVESIAVSTIPNEDRRIDETEWYEDRVVLKVVLDVEGREILVLSTHFGLNLQEQEKMVKVLVEVIDKESRPIILMGDFNTTPHSKVLEPIYDRLSSVGDITGKADIPTYFSFNPYQTIDHIFVSKHFKVLDYDVFTEIVSDHRLIRANIEIED